MGHGLRIQPVRSSREPGYPTRTVVDAQPELLRLAPRRWQGSAVVLAVLGTACVLCAARKDAKAPSSHVAPLFAYIEQNYDTPPPPGGIKAPSRLLTEDEARQVIVEEAKKAGIVFTADALTVQDVPLTHLAMYKEPAKSLGKIAVKLDGTDAKRNISYEFLATDDLTALGKQTGDWWVGSQQGGPKALHDGLVQAKPTGAFAVFHDPDRSTVDSAKEDLRKQVREFVQWLKAQGVI